MEPEKAAELLAIRCQLGEAAAFDELVEMWHLPLWRYLRKMTGDDAAAEDLVQETWLKILRGIGRLREPARLRPWLFSIARRGVMDRLRRQYAEAMVSAIDEQPEIAAELSDIGWEETEALQSSLAELPPLERETVTLFYMSELSLQEVSDVLEVPVGTVKSRLHRGRRLMRERMQERGMTR
jgi:RNA polymerase sigma factor (sigma-70 family)